MYSTNTGVSGSIVCGTSSIVTSNTISLTGITSSTLNIVYGTSGTISFGDSSKTFYVNGHEVEVDNVYNQEYYGLIFSMLSLFGNKAYETLKLNGVRFDKKVEEQLKIIFRDEKIENLLINTDKET